MTKERGRVAPPEQKDGGGKAAASKKAKSGAGAKSAQSAQPAAGPTRAEKKADGAGALPSKGARGDAGGNARGDAGGSAGGSSAGAARKGQAKSKEATSGKKSPALSKRRATDVPPADRPLADLASMRASASTPPPALAPSPTAPEREADPKGWVDALVERWVRRGQMLLQRLAQHGAADHEYRADLKDGRFVWIGPDGGVSAEARAAVLCSWSRSTSVLLMGWADPVVRYASIDEIEGMPSEHDDIDEEKAWHLAMEVAELSGAEYLYRVPTPHAWYFLALSELLFDPALPSFRPGTPVGLVLRELAETREAIESRAEPADVIRERLSSFGSALLHQAEYAYRDTDWVARLERTGRTLAQLAGRLPRQSYATIAAGQPSDEWIERDLALDLVQAIALLEDEWSLFT